MRLVFALVDAQPSQQNITTNVDMQVLLANKVKGLWGHKLLKTWLTQQRDMRDPHRMQVVFHLDRSVSTLEYERQARGSARRYWQQ